MAEISWHIAEQLLITLEMHIAGYEDTGDGARILFIDSHQHGGSPIAKAFPVHLVNDDYIDSDVLLVALFIAGIFTNKQLRDAWENFKLPTPDWL